jgi:hypothetical protein
MLNICSEIQSLTDSNGARTRYVFECNWMAGESSDDELNSLYVAYSKRHAIHSLELQLGSSDYFGLSMSKCIRFGTLG